MSESDLGGWLQPSLCRFKSDPVLFFCLLNNISYNQGPSQILTFSQKRANLRKFVRNSDQDIDSIVQAVRNGEEIEGLLHAKNDDQVLFFSLGSQKSSNLNPSKNERIGVNTVNRIEKCEILNILQEIK